MLMRILYFCFFPIHGLRKNKGCTAKEQEYENEYMFHFSDSEYNK